MGENVLLYGNCQTTALYPTFKQVKDWSVRRIICHTTAETKLKFTQIIKNMDIIITQPIGMEGTYRGKDYLSTLYILKHCKETCRVIIFPSLYDSFYYFDAGFLIRDDAQLSSPNKWHYGRMVDSYNNGLSVDEYIEQVVNNEDLLSVDMLESIAV